MYQTLIQTNCRIIPHRQNLMKSLTIRHSRWKNGQDREGQVKPEWKMQNAVLCGNLNLPDGWPLVTGYCNMYTIVKEGQMKTVRKFYFLEMYSLLLYSCGRHLFLFYPYWLRYCPASLTNLAICFNSFEICIVADKWYVSTKPCIKEYENFSLSHEMVYHYDQ